MSFLTQALETEYITKEQVKLEPKVYDVPVEIKQRVCKLKLKSMSLAIDKLTTEQRNTLPQTMKEHNFFFQLTITMF